MRIFINENDARFRTIGFGSITGGYLSNGFTGQQLVEEYLSLTNSGENAHIPEHWGWCVESVTKSAADENDPPVPVSNFAYMLLGRTLDSGIGTKEPYDKGFWRSITRTQISSYHQLHHPSALNYDDQAFTYKGQDKRFVLIRRFEYRFYLTKVPNAQDNASEQSQADNLPDGFNMELRAFI